VEGSSKKKQHTDTRKEFKLEKVTKKSGEGLTFRKGIKPEKTKGGVSGNGQRNQNYEKNIGIRTGVFRQDYGGVRN